MSQKEKNKTPPELDDQLEEAAAKEAAEEPAEAEAGAPDPLMDELEALKDQAARQEEKYLRLAAEYDNFRKRTAKEKEAIWNDAKADAALAFLPVYDNLERALKQETADEAYKKGVEMTMNQLKEVLTKLEILQRDARFSKHNPIESIKSRVKSPMSILEKMHRKGFPISLESIKTNLNDIAGIRVICSFESDVYLIAEALLRQTDVQLIERVDYIANPKPNGYRSLHLVIAIPIFLYDEKKIMKVEVQLRTMAMDMWASLEHKLAYKKQDSGDSQKMHDNLLECADLSARIDKLMEETRGLAG